MKTNLYILPLLAIFLMISACKKDGAKPVVTTKTATQTQPTLQQLLLGKWYVTRDSVQTLDYLTPVANVQPKMSFSNSDYIVFANDTTAGLSSGTVFNAVYTNYISTNTTSVLSYSPVSNPDLNSKYHLITVIQGNTPAETVYGISMQNDNPIPGVGFSITMSDATHMVLYHQEILPTTLHEWVVNQYLYLQK